MRLVAAIVLFGLAGCVTPSIPIPPPDPTKMTFGVTVDGQGNIDSASLTYPPTTSYVGGVAYVYNRSRGVGVIQNVNGNGSIGPTPPVSATTNDELVVSVEADTQTVSTCVLLSANGPAGYCQ